MIRGYFKLNADNLLNQRKVVALISAGTASGNIFFDISGRSAELTKLFGILRRGDMLVVPSAADIAASPAELAQMVEKFAKMGVRFAAVEEPWLAYQMATAQDLSFAQSPALNRMAQQNQEPKRSVGRPKGPQQDIIPKLNFALNLYHTAGHLSIRQICAIAKLNERTFYRHLERQGYHVVRRIKGRKPSKGVH